MNKIDGKLFDKLVLISPEEAHPVLDRLNTSIFLSYVEEIDIFNEIFDAQYGDNNPNWDDDNIWLLIATDINDLDFWENVSNIVDSHLNKVHN